MRWSDVDLESRWWSIPATVAKNGQAHRVPLSEGVVDILKARREAASEAAVFVFENRPGSGSVAHRGKKAASALCRSLTFEFRAHDLRRTAATRMYDRYNYDAEKRDALDRWALRPSSRARRRRWSLSVHDDLGHGAATAKIDVRCR